MSDLTHARPQRTRADQLSQVPYLPGLDGLRAIAVGAVTAVCQSKSESAQKGGWEFAEKAGSIQLANLLFLMLAVIVIGIANAA